MVSKQIITKKGLLETQDKEECSQKEKLKCPGVLLFSPKAFRLDPCLRI